jgi:hypothetical protein
MLFHRRQRRLHVVIGFAGEHLRSGHFTHGRLRRERVARGQGDVHIAVGDHADQLAFVVDDGQDAAVGIEHQRRGLGEVRLAHARPRGWSHQSLDLHDVASFSATTQPPAMWE